MAALSSSSQEIFRESARDEGRERGRVWVPYVPTHALLCTLSRIGHARYPVPVISTLHFLKYASYHNSEVGRLQSRGEKGSNTRMIALAAMREYYDVERAVDSSI